MRPRDVPGFVAEPVRGSERGAALHLRQGGETRPVPVPVGWLGVIRVVVVVVIIVRFIPAAVKPLGSGFGSVSDSVSIS